MSGSLEMAPSSLQCVCLSYATHVQGSRLEHSMIQQRRGAQVVTLVSVYCGHPSTSTAAIFVSTRLGRLEEVACCAIQPYVSSMADPQSRTPCGHPTAHLASRNSQGPRLRPATDEIRRLQLRSWVV